MTRLLLSFILCAVCLPQAQAQQLSLDSCRALALRNNKQLNVARLKQEVAQYNRKAMRTKYLPKVDAVGGYEYFSKEISLLNSNQKTAFSSLGTTAAGSVGTSLNQLITGLAQQGIITPEAAQQLGTTLSKLSPQLAEAGNKIGQAVNDAFRTDTKNIWSGAVMVRQPIFMGGAIVAANKMADIGERMAASDLDMRRQSTLYDIDQAYWLVVSLRQKEQLAHSYRDLVKKLSDDVHKMIREGVATKADGLKVDVKVNEADMQVTQVEDGLVLARMMLCQLCGLPMNQNITLADESKNSLDPAIADTYDNVDSTYAARPEIQMLEDAVELSRQSTRLARAAALPHVMLTGGYITSNPNVFNGFERKFAGVWNIGVLVQIPVWNWGESSYKIRAAKTASSIATMELSDVREKVNLQVAQSRFKLKESLKRYHMATQNMKSAEENLRCANLGFKEGVMEITDVMAAQTAWQMAQSQKIDAEVGVKLSQVNVKKALGILN